MAQVKFAYDSANDVLFLYNEDVSSAGSIEIADFIVSFDRTLMKIASLEILDASKVLSELLKKGLTPDMLACMKSADLAMVHRPNGSYVIYNLLIVYMEKEITVRSALPIAETIRAAA